MQFKRKIIPENNLEQTADLLQKNMVNLVDLGLLLKQAHWAVVGKNFRSLHLQLDEILLTVRESSDEVAERLSTLGVSPDGRSSTVAKTSDLADYPQGFLTVDSSVSPVADAVKTVCESLRSAIPALAEADPISEDLFIGISSQLEKHLWMLQAQEV